MERIFWVYLNIHKTFLCFTQATKDTLPLRNFMCENRMFDKQVKFSLIIFDILKCVFYASHL
jgi:hypothetical protein